MDKNLGIRGLLHRLKGGMKSESRGVIFKLPKNVPKTSSKNFIKVQPWILFKKRAEEKSHFPASFRTNLDKN